MGQKRVFLHAVAKILMQYYCSPFFLKVYFIVSLLARFSRSEMHLTTEGKENFHDNWKATLSEEVAGYSLALFLCCGGSLAQCCGLRRIRVMLRWVVQEEIV